MTIALNNAPDFIRKAPHSMAYLDHFVKLDSDLWSTVEADSGATVTHDADGVNGKALITTGGTDNNEAYMYTPELFKIAADRAIMVEAMIDFDEANTDDANVIFGLMDGVAANHLQDDGGGPVASFDGAVIYKVDGETRWRVRSSNAATAKSHETEITAGGNAQLLRICIQAISSATAEITYWIDENGGQAPTQVREYDVNDRIPPIKHEIAISGLEEMALVIGAKAGSANSEVISVDFASWLQTL